MPARPPRRPAWVPASTSDRSDLRSPHLRAEGISSAPCSAAPSACTAMAPCAAGTTTTRVSAKAPPSRFRRCAVTSMRCSGRPPPLPPYTSPIQSIASSVPARPVATRPCAGAASSTCALPSAMRTPVWLCPAALLLVRARTAIRLPRLTRTSPLPIGNGASIEAASDSAAGLRSGCRQLQRRADQVGAQLQQRRRGAALRSLCNRDADRPLRTAVDMRLEPGHLRRAIEQLGDGHVRFQPGLERVRLVAHEVIAGAQRQRAWLALLAHAQFIGAETTARIRRRDH